MELRGIVLGPGFIARLRSYGSGLGFQGDDDDDDDDDDHDGFDDVGSHHLSDRSNQVIRATVLRVCVCVGTMARFQRSIKALS